MKNLKNKNKLSFIPHPIFLYLSLFLFSILIVQFESIFFAPPQAPRISHYVTWFWSTFYFNFSSFSYTTHLEYFFFFTDNQAFTAFILHAFFYLQVPLVSLFYYSPSKGILCLLSSSVWWDSITSFHLS